MMLNLWSQQTADLTDEQLQEMIEEIDLFLDRLTAERWGRRHGYGRPNCHIRHMQKRFDALMEDFEEKGTMDWKKFLQDVQDRAMLDFRVGCPLDNT
jgi:hypothetical protein